MSERQWNGSPEFPIDNRPTETPLPPPQEPPMMIDALGNKHKFVASECPTFNCRPAALAGETRTEAPCDLDNGNSVCTVHDDFRIDICQTSLTDQRAAAASRIAQLQDTNRELNRRVGALQHSLNLESGRKSWYRFFQAAMTCFKNEANRAETAEAALTQAQQEIKALAAEMPRWVPVAEKLPEDEQEVLCWIVDDNTSLGGERREYQEVWEFNSRYPGGFQNTDVTHWLDGAPSPPREEAK